MRNFRLSLFFSILTIAAGTFPLWAQSFPKESYEHYTKYLLYLKKDQPEKALAELILSYQTNPKAQHLLTEIVEMALDLRQLEIARVYASIAAEVKPKDPETNYLQAQVLQATGEYQEALKLLLETNKTAPDNPAVLMSLASVYAQLDERKKSLEYLNAYLKLAPASPELLKIKAHYEIQEGSAAAIGTLKDAFNEDPEDPEILDALIMAYNKFSTQEALSYFFDQAINDYPDNPDLPIKRCASKNSIDSQLNCLEELMQNDPSNTAGLGYWLDLLEKHEQWDEALEALRQFPQATNNEPVFALKESFYLLHQDRLQAAVDVLEKARTKFPLNDDIPYFLALGYEDLNNHGQAKTILAELYQRRPDWREMAYTYALTCGEVQDFACMEMVLENLRRTHPDDPVILNALGFTWTEEGKNLDQARGLIERALSSDPTNFSYQDSLAWVLFKLGRIEEASRILKNAAAVTQDPEILLHLSELEQHEGQKQEAWSSYLSAQFELARTRKTSARLLESMKRLEKILDQKAKPKPQEVLENRVASAPEGFSGLFQCEWNLRSQTPVRMRFSLKNFNPQDLKVYYWPPGVLTPLNKNQVIESFAPSKPIIEEFEEALKGFFSERSWASHPTAQKSAPSRQHRLQWKISNDFSIRASGSTIDMKFFNFYRDVNISASAEQSLLPRSIELDSSFLKGTCEALDYAKE